MMEASTSPTPSCAMLEALPLLVHEMLCEFLAISDFKRRSLYAFSLTSKRCYAATVRERFERICFAANNPQQLRQSLARADDVLRTDGRTRHIRRIKIIGRMSAEGEDTELAQLLCSENDEDGFSEVQPLSSFDGREPAVSEEYKSRSHRGWLPLAGFLAKCPGLKYFIWASTDQIPRCALDVLHNQLPKTRLQVETSSLRSLYQKKNALHDVDPDEYALATSPSLYSIRAISMYHNSQGFIDYNEEAILQMVMQLAPNLRSVHMHYQIASHSPELLELVRTPRLPWRRFTPSENVSKRTSQGQLTELSLIGGYPIRLEEIQKWSLHTDFSKLGTLKLDHMEEDALSALAQMAFSGAFARLHTLSLDVGYTLECRKVVADDLFPVLLPLSDLTIEGEIDNAILESIFQRHGSSLTRLKVGCLILDEDVESLCKSCLNVRDLQLMTNRRLGDEQEVRLYQTLGSILKLEKLTLILQCEVARMQHRSSMQISDYRSSASTQSLPSQEVIDREEKIKGMCSALINSAVDARLAESIFHIMLATNRATRPDVAPSLRCLALHCRPDDKRYYFKQLQGVVAGSWMCERKFADRYSKDIIVRKIHRVQEMRMMYLMEKIDQNFKWCDDGELYRLAWERVWPEAKGKTCWTDEWHSFPLWQET